MKSKLSCKYSDIISLENLLSAWQEFIIGKKSKPDVQKFSLNLMDNIISLHYDLVNGKYQHGSYQSFKINDPKPRHIHKAAVRDRLVHHAVHRLLYPFFDKIFISDSYSCRLNKGAHKAINRFRKMACQASQNNTQTCWVLKCDIKKFFASVNHQMLLKILDERVPDKKVLKLLEKIIKSFNIIPGRGLPLGNLTSQLFANICLNEFDQFVKHKLKAKYYLRYADDFVLLSSSRAWLANQIPRVQKFLQRNLFLKLHPEKVFIQTLFSGLDFLGWVHFPHHRVLRSTTKRRLLRRLKTHNTQETLQSYLGLLAHGNSFKLQQELLNIAWL